MDFLGPYTDVAVKAAKAALITSSVLNIAQAIIGPAPQLFDQPPVRGAVPVPSDDVWKVGYKKNIPSKCDVIIIGAGTSGLISAALLSKAGKKARKKKKKKIIITSSKKKKIN
jgi:hypothetical protein